MVPQDVDTDIDDFEHPPEGGPGDIRHDQYLIPSDPALVALADAIFHRLETTFPRPIKQRSDATGRRRDITHNLVASLALLVRQPGASMGLIRRNKGQSLRYDRPAFPDKAFWQMVGEMEAAGYLEWVKGVRRRHTSLIRPTPMFREMVPTLGDKPVVIQPDAETIILRAYSAKHGGRVETDYKDDADTVRMRSEMVTINEMLASANIRLDGQPLPPQRLVRIFLTDDPTATGRFKRHGRLYRGGWQTLPRAKRASLSINGATRLVDLDYRAMHLSLAYARQGMAMPSGDPYAIHPELAASREGVKKIISAMFHHGRIKRLSPKLAALFPLGWNAKRVTDAILAAHPMIAGAFEDRLGQALTFTESDIMVAVVLRLAELAAVSLPCHDGLLIAAEHRDLAIETMRTVGLEAVGTALNVEEKLLFF